MIFNRYQNKKERALLFTTSFILPKSRTAGYQHFPNLQTITRWIEHHTFALKFAMELNLIKHFRIDFIEFNRQSLSISTTRNGFIARSIEVRFFFEGGGVIIESLDVSKLILFWRYGSIFSEKW